MRTEHQREVNRVRAKVWRETNVSRRIQYAFASNLRKFGLTPACYERLLLEQNGVCAICQRPEISKNRSGDTKRLSIDHDWRTGKVRGLLCIHCNTSLGNFNDDPALLLKAIEYLTQSELGEADCELEKRRDTELYEANRE